jgi:hypothetical protein
LIPNSLCLTPSMRTLLFVSMRLPVDMPIYKPIAEDGILWPLNGSLLCAIDNICTVPDPFLASVLFSDSFMPAFSKNLHHKNDFNGM